MARTALLLALAGALGSGSVVALAQERARGRAESRAPEETSSDASTEADSEEVVEHGGEKVKVIRFSGLDIAGRLKSPQLLYFLNRLRAEFSRPRLPHRSFLPELEASTGVEDF